LLFGNHVRHVAEHCAHETRRVVGGETGEHLWRLVDAGDMSIVVLRRQMSRERNRNATGAHAQLQHATRCVRGE